MQRQSEKITIALNTPNAVTVRNFEHLFISIPPPKRYIFYERIPDIEVSLNYILKIFEAAAYKTRKQ